MNAMLHAMQSRFAALAFATPHVVDCLAVDVQADGQQDERAFECREGGDVGRELDEKLADKGVVVDQVAVVHLRYNAADLVLCNRHQDHP